MSSNGQSVNVPPQNLEAEESVLGAMMVSEAAIDPVLLEVHLREEDFYRDRHREIFGAVRKLYEDSEPVDALTVSEALAQRGKLEDVGGKDAIAGLVSAVPAPGNARHYAQIIKQNSLLRRLLAAAQGIQQSVHERDGDPRELVEEAERILFSVAHDDSTNDFRSIEEILIEETDRLEDLSTGKGELTGTPSGFTLLDEKTGGFQPGNLVVIAARPSMGKSALVCNIAEHVATKAAMPVAFFSLEMSETELAHRFIATKARISADKLRKGQVQREWSRVIRACNELGTAPLWIDDSSDLGMLELRAKARRLKSTNGGKLGLIIVDYIQLLRAEDPRVGRVEQVGQMSRGLKILARELEVPVIALSQLSRAPEQRPDKIPLLADLRESGCLTGDTPVYLPETGRYVPIAELDGRAGFDVLGVDTDTWRLRRGRVSKAFCTGTKQVYGLRMRSGRVVRATANHRFLTVEGWRRLDELAVDEHLALPRSLSGPEVQSIPDDELALLAHLIGDGCTLPRHTIQYTSNESALAVLVARLASSAFGAEVAPRIKRERGWYQAYLPASAWLARGRRNPIARWLDDLGVFGLRSHEKRVPEAVFEQPAGAIALFLRHLWATDGCVWLGRGKRGYPAIYYATSSAQLAADVQSLLLRLGITGTRRLIPQRGGRPQHHVAVSGGHEMRTFIRVVGALEGPRAERSRAILASLEDRAAPNTNRDVVPRSVWQSRVKPALSEQGITTRALQSSLGVNYCGSALYKSNLSRDRAARVAEVVRSPELAGLASSDVYWDRIESIEPAGVEPVYDLTVDDIHNFVAGDVIVHNSIEQDADVVGFIFREEYYEKENSERPGEADLIIAKHRNGPIGTVPLAFLEHYPSFANLARQSDVDGQDFGDAADVAEAV